MPSIYEVTTTVESLEQATELANTLVARRLVACAQVTGPVHSVYEWQAEVCQASEQRCTLKTSSARLANLLEILDELHPYDLPEVLVNEVGTSPGYAAWVEKQTTTAKD